MSSESVPIKYTDASQEKEALQKVAGEVSKILTPNEEIYYIALQNISAVTLKKDSVAVTSNRVILFKPGLLGRITFEDFNWEIVKNVQIKQGFVATDFTVETTDGRKAVLGGLDKDQAKRLYGVCQQLEQEWREKRRVRQMEEDRARAGGIYMPAPVGAGAAAAEDPVEKLARAKKMLDQGLISETEYDTLKAKILASM